MKTIYVSGKKGFIKRLVPTVLRNNLSLLEGYTLPENSERECQLFWAPEDFDPIKIKYAMGAKEVFRYRVRLYTNEMEVHASAVQEALSASNFLDDLAELEKTKQSRIPY